MTAPRTPTTSRSATHLAARELLRQSGWLGWVLALLLLAVLVVHTLIAAGWTATTPTPAAPIGTAAGVSWEVRSIWEFVEVPLRWALFVAGILIAARLPLLVAHGLTRRAVTRAGGAVAVILAAAAGLYLAVGFLVENAWFTRTGPRLSLSGTHLFDSVGQVHLVVAEYGLASAVYLVSGWLVGTAYYRFGAARGTLCLPLTAGLPLLAAEFLLTSRGRMWTRWEPVQWDAAGRATGFEGTPVVVSPWLAIVLGVGVLVASLLAVHALTRTIPVRTTVRS